MYHTLIDFSYIFYKSVSICKYHYNRDIDLMKEEDRGFVIRKVTTDLCKIINELNSDRVYFCFDYGDTWRRGVDARYKGTRGEKDPWFKETQEEVFNIYTEKGLNCVRVNGLEADDLIALLHSSLKGRKLIVTKDEDLRQLIDKDTYVYVPDPKAKTFYYQFDSQLRYKPKEGLNYIYEQVDPEYILFIKLLKGCSSDEVAPLLPKGYRMTKVLELFQHLLLSTNNEDRYSKRILESLSIDTKLSSIKEEDIEKQLKLVCLKEEYFPKFRVESFYLSVSKIEKSEVYSGLFQMKEILLNTPYITENYSELNSN